MALMIGTMAPDFVLTGWHAGITAPYRVSSQRGRPLVLAFYPGDEQRTSTRQLRSYSTRLAELHKLGAEVWGVSPQDVHSHREFAAVRSLRLPLLADTNQVVAQMYGIVGPFGPHRAVFVIDTDGRVAWRWISPLNLRFPRTAEIVRALSRAVATT